MIYNNTGSAEGLKNAWGLSIWIDSPDGVTLFDTGGKPEILEENMKFLGLDASKVNQVILSHDHWDHKGGLEMIFGKLEKKTKLYVPGNVEEEYASALPAAVVTGVKEPVEINNGIWSTGSLFTDLTGEGLQEQSVILAKGENMMILTGCSHPGIVDITNRAKKIHPDKNILLVAGGFHLLRTPKDEVEMISDELKKLGVERIAPSHCTGDRSIDVFRERWGDSFVDINLGDKASI